LVFACACWSDSSWPIVASKRKVWCPVALRKIEGGRERIKGVEVGLGVPVIVVMADSLSHTAFLTSDNLIDAQIWSGFIGPQRAITSGNVSAAQI